MTIKQLKQKLPTIKEIIGWKEFPEEKDKLLIQAFIRRSYSQEHPEWQHNQVLEFIGDSVLDSYFVRLLCSPEFKNYGSYNNSAQFVSTKNEGELTKIKAQYVNGEALAKHIDNLNVMCPTRAITEDMKIPRDVQAIYGSMFDNGGW